MSEWPRNEPHDPSTGAGVRLAAERGPAALVLVDGAVTWANHAAADLLGLAVQDIVGVLLPDLAPRTQRGAVWTGVAAGLLDGPGGQAMGLVRRHDETTVRVQVRVAVCDGGRLVTLVPDVDAVNAAESALAEAEHRFRALADHAPIGIVLSEAGLRLGYVNGPFAALMDADPTGLLGTAWLDCVHTEDLPALYVALQEVLAGRGQDVTLRVVPRRLTGERSRWLRLRLAPTTTPARAAGFVGTAEDVTARRAWEEQISYQANHDPLTGLVNRRRLVEVLSDLLESKRGNDRAFAVLFLDLDGFKEINDTWGHDVGDRVLIEIGRRMQRTAREYDVLARIAGDEFVIVLRNVHSVTEAEAAATRHLAALTEPLRIGRSEVRLTASVGVAVPAGHDSPESLLRSADQVMYDAKAAGPGLFRVAPAPTSAVEVPRARAGEGA